MNFFDLEYFEDESSIETNICIIGSGPAGLSIAKEFSGTSVDILVVESGGFEDESTTQALYNIESIGDPRCINQENIRRRIWGGSSHIWTGRCAPFEDMDFEHRPWIKYSGWPLTRKDLDPYLERAGRYLGLGPHCYDETVWEKFHVKSPTPSLDDQFLEHIFWQFSESSKVPGSSVDFGRDLEFPKAPNINALLHANVTHINTNAEGNQFESVEVRTLGGRRCLVRAKILVLSCGGIENARILLASNRTVSQGLGNQNDLVGRFLMDHTLFVSGYFNPNDANKVNARFGHYWLDDQEGRHVYLHGLSLSEEIQKSEHLVRCHAFIENYDIPANSPWLAIRRLKSNLKSRKFNKDTLQDLKILLANTGEVVQGMNRRTTKHRPELINAGRTELHCMLEQIPDPDSRITLSSEKKDSLGMPVSNIDWRINEIEKRTALRMTQLICQEFPKINLPTPVLRSVPEEENWKHLFGEKAHPTGTTRLSESPKEGVVDTNLQVHGIAGLFVVGSSVFPTSGAANPTLMIIALAMRLSDWLKENYFSSHFKATAKSRLLGGLKSGYAHATPSVRSSEKIRIGFVGAGQRIEEVYLPILNRLSDSYEIVGFTTQSTLRAQKFTSKTGIPAFSNASDLVEKQKPTFLISAVSSNFNEETLLGLIDLKVPILTETPFAWSVSRGEKILSKAKANQVSIAVAEQFPYLPLEQFKKKLVELEIFGDIYAAYNDFSTYSYHGIAQLRQYFRAKPIRVRSLNYDFGLDQNLNSRPQYPNIQWKVGSVIFEDGAVLFHNYSDHYTVSSLGFPQTVRLYGRSASMVDHDIRYVSPKTGDVKFAQAVRQLNQADALVSIEANLPEIGKIVWNNPYVNHAFTDEQIAVATIIDGMVNSIRTDSSALYSAENFLVDVAIIQAFRYSAQRNGVEVSLPFNEKLQKVFLATDANYLKRKISG